MDEKEARIFHRDRWKMTKRSIIRTHCERICDGTSLRIFMNFSFQFNKHIYIFNIARSSNYTWSLLMVKIATTSPSLVSTGSIRSQKRLYGLPWRVRGAVSVYWGPTRTGDCARNSLSATRLFVPVVIVVVGGAGGGGGAIGGGGTVDGGWC